MALFSRRPKPSADGTPSDPTADAAAESTAEVEAAPQADASAGVTPGQHDGTEVDASAGVSISMSSFTGLGAATPSAPQAGQAEQPERPETRPRPGARTSNEVAPAPSETIPGLRDNVLLRDALGRVEDGPQAQALLDVARQLLQGHVFLRVKGDARSLLAEGKSLPLAVVNSGERRFAVAYSGGAALQASLRADGDTDTSAMGQPVLAVLRHVLGGRYDGIVIDQSSAPARAVLPRELLQKMLDQADSQLTVKTLLSAERTSETAAAVAEALTHAPLWVAVGQAEGGVPGLAEGRTKEGARYLEVYSHPLEVAVMGRGDNAAPLTGAQLAKALDVDSGLDGVIVDPAGPWIRLTRDDLAPVLALAG